MALFGSSYSPKNTGGWVHYGFKKKSKPFSTLEHQISIITTVQNASLPSRPRE